MVNPKPLHELEGLCPVCGSKIPAAKLFVDLSTNTISYSGRTWRVAAKIAEFAYALSRKWPQVVNDTELREAMWGLDGYDRHPSQLSFYAHHLRCMLLPLGGDVERLKGRGYRLVLRELEAVA